MGAHHCAITRQILADSIIKEQALFTPPLKAEFLLTERGKFVVDKFFVIHALSVKCGPLSALVLRRSLQIQ